MTQLRRQNIQIFNFRQNLNIKKRNFRLHCSFKVLGYKLWMSLSYYHATEINAKSKIHSHLYLFETVLMIHLNNVFFIIELAFLKFQFGCTALNLSVRNFAGNACYICRYLSRNIQGVLSDKLPDHNHIRTYYMKPTFSAVAYCCRTPIGILDGAALICIYMFVYFLEMSLFE